MGWLFNKKTYPDYWNQYVKHFDESAKKSFQSTRFVALDTETTGFNYDIDRLLCIGAISIINNEMSVANAFEIYIKQKHFNPNTVKIHGLIHNTRIKTVSEEEALIQFLRYIEDSILIAHHAEFDITMINMALKRLGLPKLKNKVIDTMDLYARTRIKSNFITQNKKYSLDEIAEDYAINLCDRHTASGDALITAIIFLKTAQTLNKSKGFELKSMFIKSNRF